MRSLLRCMFSPLPRVSGVDVGTCLLGRYVLDVAPRSALNVAFLGLDMTSDPLLALGAAAPKGARRLQARTADFFSVTTSIFQVLLLRDLLTCANSLSLHWQLSLEVFLFTLC